MKNIFKAFQKHEDLVLGYAIGLLDGEVIETAFLDKNVYLDKNGTLKKAIFKKSVSTLLKTLKIDKKMASKLVLEIEDDLEVIVVDLEEEDSTKVC